MEAIRIQDLAQMSSFIKGYIRRFTNNTSEDSPLLKSINDLVSRADIIGYFETMLNEAYGNGVYVCCEICSRGSSNYVKATYNELAECRARTLYLFEPNLG